MNKRIEQDIMVTKAMMAIILFPNQLTEEEVKKAINFTKNQAQEGLKAKSTEEFDEISKGQVQESIAFLGNLLKPYGGIEKMGQSISDDEMNQNIAKAMSLAILMNRPLESTARSEDWEAQKYNATSN